ncbi:MAG: hypothetical protein B7Z75_06235 [Acidocella sp. 20-57-95]|nr:MAG: hypothetical protein B7Z75_06235 [Acidocella sp. 20-57-95]
MTDTDVNRLRRESRDARKIRYSASRVVSSTKNSTNNAFSINFFWQRAKKTSIGISPRRFLHQLRFNCALTDTSLTTKNFVHHSAQTLLAFFDGNENQILRPGIIR